MYPILDTRVLIQIGIKQRKEVENYVYCLRALLIQIGIKLIGFLSMIINSLRALLIQIGIKQGNKYICKC